MSCGASVTTRPSVVWSTGSGRLQGRRPSRAGRSCNWHVDDIAATFERLLSMGATEYGPITARGEQGFVTAAVVDPFGNGVGVVYNRHYVQILRSGEPA
jgi:predicted enzyme related to lactoylglutathione lyase